MSEEGHLPEQCGRQHQVVGDIRNAGTVKSREHITPGELHQALREHGVATIADVYMATLEIDGSISVLKNDERPTSFQPHHRIHLMRRTT